MSEFFTLNKNDRLKKYQEYYYDQKLSWSKIAEMCGTNSNRVRRDATKLGIVSRDKSEAQKIAIEEGRHEHPTKGKVRSDETKLKISESQGAVWDSLSEEEKEHRSKIGLEAWNKKTDREKAEFFKKSTQAVQEASRKGSKVESYVFDFLLENGYRVKRHKEHILKNEKFHIDLYVEDVALAIEIDGPMHFEPVYGEEKLQKRQAADFQKNGLILSSGMALVRVKLVKRQSQRYLREITEKILSVIESLKNGKLNTQERYFEV